MARNEKLYNLLKEAYETIGIDESEFSSMAAQQMLKDAGCSPTNLYCDEIPHSTDAKLQAHYGISYHDQNDRLMKLTGEVYALRAALEMILQDETIEQAHGSVVNALERSKERM